jgi:transcriptional regulator with XRE-family HTH domain
MITSGQCRAARAWLGWSQNDLAKASGLTIGTVVNFERDQSIPRSRSMNEIVRAIGIAGIRPVFQGGRAIGIISESRE